MKKPTLTLLAALLMLLMSHPLKAQTPMVPYESLVKYSSPHLAVYNSIVRVWDDAYIVSSKPSMSASDTSVLSLVNMNTLTSSDTERFFYLPTFETINDMRIDGDYAYCCETDGAGGALLSCFKVAEMLTSSVARDFVKLNAANIKKIKKLVVYRDNSGTRYLAAVGVSGNDLPCILEAKIQSPGGFFSQFSYNYVECFPDEKYDAIVATEDYIVAVGTHDNGSDYDICMRWYAKGHFDDLAQWKGSFYPGATDDLDNTVKVAFLRDNQIAVANDYEDQTAKFVYVNTFDLSFDSMVNRIMVTRDMTNRRLNDMVYVLQSKKLVICIDEDPTLPDTYPNSIHPGYLFELDPWATGTANVGQGFLEMSFTRYVPSIDVAYGRRVVGRCYKYFLAHDIPSGIPPSASNSCFEREFVYYNNIPNFNPVDLEVAILLSGEDPVSPLSPTPVMTLPLDYSCIHQ